ncbi:MAG: HlyC/CorC family transporter [Alphaproteobacteria bacterium]|nr:HlyC/CorC family transporter [Alphaproteobacteria bacterium]
MDIGFLISVISIVVLLLASAFFSGSETALTAASRAVMASREKEGNARAAAVNRVRAKKDRMIGALLLGNNFVNILASAIATSVLIRVFGDAGVVYATIVMTMVVLIFSEVLPKTYALHHAESLSLRVVPMVRVAILVFAPITEAVAWIVRMILKMFGIDISKVGAGSHLELLRGVIEMHSGPEEETQAQRAMLRSILDLAKVDVSDIMTHRRNVVMIDGSLSMKKIVDSVLETSHTRLPLWKDNQDDIIGIIHVKHVLRELHAAKGVFSKIQLEKILMEPRFVPDTTNLYDQLQAFRENQEHFAIVVDEYGTFMGVVTLEDILEEIVGEIDDEHDISVAGVRKMPGNVFVVDGAVTIRDLNREFEWGLPDEEYSTLAGLVIYEAQMLPQVGQSFSFHGFRFDIIKRQRNQITKIRVTPPAHLPADEQG